MSEIKICKHCSCIIILEHGIWVHGYSGSRFCYRNLSSNSSIAEPADSVKNVPISTDAHKKTLCENCNGRIIFEDGAWVHNSNGLKNCSYNVHSKVAKPPEFKKAAWDNFKLAQTEMIIKAIAGEPIATAQQSDTPQRVYKSCVNCHYDFVCSLNPRNIELPIDARRAKKFFDDPTDVKHQIADIVGKNCKFFMPANPNQTKGNAHEHSRGESEKP